MSTDFPDWYQAELNSKDDVNHVRQNIAKTNVSCSALLDARSELVKVAASLLTNQMSWDADDWKFSKSTPKKDKMKVIKEAEKRNEFQRIAAIKIKSVVDVLLGLLIRDCQTKK